MLESINILVEYNKQTEHLPVLVVSGAGPSLQGKDWMSKIWVNLGTMVSHDPSQYSRTATYATNTLHQVCHQTWLSVFVAKRRKRNL